MQSEWLEIVIGVVFIWFVLSTLMSAVNEAFSLTTHARAKHLWLGVGRLVDPVKGTLPRRLWDVGIRLPFSGKLDLRPKVTPSAGAAGEQTGGFVSRVTASMTDRPDRKGLDEIKELRPRLQELYETLAPQLAEIAKPGRLSKLSQVASKTFSEAVLDLAKDVRAGDLRPTAIDLGWPTPKVRALQDLLEGAEPGAPITVDELLQRPRPDPSELDDDDLRSLFDEAGLRLSARDVAAYFDSNPELAKAIRRSAVGVDARERAQAVRTTVESWFDREMDQLSSFYRRQSRKITALLAIPIVLAFQTNAVALVHDLHHDAALRQALSSQAVSTAASASVQEAVAENCARTTPTTTGSTATTSPLDSAAQQLDCGSRIVAQADRFHAGLAWDDFKSAHGRTGDVADAQVADIWPFLTSDWAWVGRAITLIAILFGAQFWFDILRRAVGLRGGAQSKADKQTT